jgi:muramoyltetrapeptide carboxypeptidase
MIKTPPYLQPGDTIGLVCPAGFMSSEKAKECIRVLQEEWGYQVKVGATVGGNSATYFSATDEERLIDFQDGSYYRSDQFQKIQEEPEMDHWLQ